MWWQQEIPDAFCKCNPHWRVRARRFQSCTPFNLWMRPSVASRWNRPGVNPFLQPIVEGNAGFLRDVPQLLDHWQNQRHTFLAPRFLHLAFGISRNQRTICARRWFGGAKDTDVVVDLTLKGITIHKAVDAHRAEEMADAFPDAAFRHFLAKGKGRRKRPPIRPAEHPTAARPDGSNLPSPNRSGRAPEL